MKKLLSVFLIVGFIFAASSTQTLSFQGKLLDNTGAAVTGTRAMVFTMYSQATGGTAVPNATWSQSVAVQNGLYSVELDASAVDMSNVNDTWIEVAVAGEILSPRIHLTSSVFARRAALADTAKTLQGVVVVSGNNVGVGTTNPLEKLDVNGKIVATAQVFKASMSTNFNHPGGAWNIAPFNTVEFNQIGGSLGASSHVYTVTKAGYYRISVSGYASSGGTGSERYAIGCYVNGINKAFSGGNYSVSDTPLAGFTSIQYLSVGDVLDIRIFSAIAALFSGNPNVAAGHKMYWDMEYLGR